MNVYFGVVSKYFPEKGFGFITHPLDSKIRKDVFLHIRNVQKSNRTIADKLASYKPNDDIYFYYEAETTSKGEQVKSVLTTDGIGELLKDNLHNFTQKLEHIWQNLEIPQPVWLFDVTQDLVGIDGLNKLKYEREILIEKKKEADELKRQERERVEAERQAQLELQRQERERVEAERQKQREIQEQQRRIEAEEREWQRKIENEEWERKRKIEEAEQERQQKIKDKEFESLVAEIRSRGFTMSAQVSNYIINHRLGDKYKHISGVLVMENNGSSWKFNGGFPPDIYAKLCQELGLGSKGTNSRVVGFTAFKDL